MRKSGFTIVELVVVVTVLALLAAILIPSLQGVRTDAKSTKAAADLRTLQTAVELYINSQNTPPASLASLLLMGTDRVINEIPEDPFSPSSAKYGYFKQATWTVDTLYAASSVGPDGTADVVLADFDGDGILSASEAGDDIYVTNARRE